MAYDAPDYLIRRESPHETAAGSGTVSAKFMHFQAIRLKAVHFNVTTAGTASGHVCIVKSGTTALGTATLGTNTAGYTTSLTGLNAAVPSLTALTITNGADTVGKALVSYEFEVTPDTTESA